MGIIFTVIAFFYAYLSFQDGKMIHFYIALLLGIIFIAAMVNNIIQVRKMQKKKD